MFQIRGGTSVLSRPGTSKSGFRIFPWLGMGVEGALFFFLPPLKMKGSYGVGRKMVERHSDPPWEGQAELLCCLGRSQASVLCCYCLQLGEASFGGARCPSPFPSPNLPLIAQEVYVRKEEERLKPCAGCLSSQGPWHHLPWTRWVALS